MFKDIILKPILNGVIRRESTPELTGDGPIVTVVGLQQDFQIRIPTSPVMIAQVMAINTTSTVEWSTTAW